MCFPYKTLLYFQPLLQNLPQEPPAPEILDPGAGGENEDQQWNPMEWDRAAEELTWERLLGKEAKSLVLLID